MYQNIKKKTEGFTIIEVLIVLAIAGLIMLIVFLAVPALQRNSANNEIRNEASRINTTALEWFGNANSTWPVNTDSATLRTQAGTNRIGTLTVGTAGDPAAGAAILMAPGTCTGVNANGAGPGVRTVAVEFGLQGGGRGCIQA